MIGITTPGGYYFDFADHYLDYVSGLRTLLLNTSKLLLKAIGYDVYLKNIYIIKMQYGKGVQVVDSCLGNAVLSFWIAFVFDNKTLFWQMIKWMFIGVLVIILVNVFRISLLVIAINKHWSTLFNLDNHTWFNIAAYTAIFTMMWFFDAAQKRHQQMENYQHLMKGIE